MYGDFCLVYKLCFGCKLELPRSDYSKDSKAKDGLRCRCRKCLSIQAMEWAKNNPDKVKKSRNTFLKDYRKQPRIKEKRRIEAANRVLKKRDHINSLRRINYANNTEKMRAYRSEYLKNNPWFNRAASSRKRAEVRKRTPIWADFDKIKEVYKNCPEGMVVDHIVPLMGKTVCGLHVHENMQYLTPEQNGRKSNQWPLEDTYEILNLKM